MTTGQPPFVKTKISAAKKATVKNALFKLNGITWTPKTEQYCDYRLDGQSSDGWVRVKQYTNGTLYIQSLSQRQLDIIMGSLGLSQVSGTPKISQNSGSKTDPVINISGPYIGTDESGKGDYFGPLVVAGVYIDDASKKELEKLGVTDSKKLSDTQITRLAEQIKVIVGEDSYHIVNWLPEAYNKEYQTLVGAGKNLNHLMANSHASVISSLIVDHPQCDQVIIDQFGKDSYMDNALAEHRIKVNQAPRAEKYTAVAAASILARQQFVASLNKLSSEHGIRLPLGAGSPVLQAGKQWVQTKGHQSLNLVAKTHFKTTQQL